VLAGFTEGFLVTEVIGLADLGFVLEGSTR
jgi:hypothetical protein